MLEVFTKSCKQAAVDRDAFFLQSSTMSFFANNTGNSGQTGTGAAGGNIFGGGGNANAGGSTGTSSIFGNTGS